MVFPGGINRTFKRLILRELVKNKHLSAARQALLKRRYL
jgi:hypothetical protein